MKLSKISILIFSSLFFLFAACSTVPITGRRHLELIPDASMLSMSKEQYGAFLKSHKISTDKSQTDLVRRVGRRIQKAVEQYLTENNLAHELDIYEWEFNLVESKDVNAWAMPGGKVVVYTGILPVAQDEKGLAVIMGHEIAHVVADHGNERMSQGLIVQFGGMALSTALTTKPQQTRKLWMQVYGAGTQYVVMLPYSRLHESEADHLGLIFMAMAGYHPDTAVDFWKRMAKLKGNQTPPEFLSTHPSDERRIQNIRNLIPRAMLYYRSND